MLSDRRDKQEFEQVASVLGSMQTSNAYLFDTVTNLPGNSTLFTC